VRYTYHARELDSSYAIAKRLLDIVLGSMLLVASAPVWLLAALAIRLETKGNPFFLQARVGLVGKPFRILKLRGMYIDARQRFAQLYDYSKYQDLNFYFHQQNDPRVTKVGAFLRRTSFDELPNLWNVVMGDMTLVGPRPEVPDVMELYGEHKAKYISVKPGVTCLSKVTGRDRLTKQESIALDLAYVDRMSFRLDLSIIWATFTRVLRRHDVFSGRVDEPSSGVGHHEPTTTVDVGVDVHSGDGFLPDVASQETFSTLHSEGDTFD
jgi:lipopolysaccharide/colanic/teichoic acid biosynthesis glycosyltransferase